MRDVLLLLHPGRDLAHLLAARERHAHPATVLVPTGQAVDPALFGRHGENAHVELARLDDLLAVRDGSVAFAPALRLVAAPPGRQGRARPPAPPPRAPVRPLPPLD